MKKKIIMTISIVVLLLCIIYVLLLCIIYVLLLLIVEYHKNEFQVPVIMYHDVIPDEYYQNKADTISVTTLEKQLMYLKENNYKTLTLEEFYQWKKGEIEIPHKSVLLTFDDGFYSFHYIVEPLLKEYEMFAACFVIGSTIEDKTELYNPEKYGTVGTDIINNHSEHVEYGSHSYDLHQMINNQKKIETISEKEIDNDFKKMNEIYKFEYFSYPFNTDTKEAIKVLKKYKYKLAFRGEGEKATKHAHDYQIPRIGIDNNIEKLEKILTTDYYNNRYGNGLLRKVLITIERKIGKRLFK